MVKYHLKYKNIKKETIKAVKDHWKQGYWTGDDFHKKEVFENLLKRLCEIYEIKKIPQIIIKKDFNNDSMYIPQLNLIIMDKYSIITFLHEFKHIKDINEGKRISEENARGWCLSIIYQVNPLYLKEIVRKGLVKYLTLADMEDDIKINLNQSKCPYCFSPIRRNANYCHQCGAKL